MSTAAPIERNGKLPGHRFAQTLGRQGLRLERTAPRILQINVGRLCNLSCIHCHVNAGPGRREIMAPQTVDRILDWSRRHPLPIVDLTGGAPEMIPDFRRMVMEFRRQSADRTIIDRCNLTILLEPGYEWLGPFLCEQRVEIVASMPCYSADNVNAQRGEGVFDASIRALQLLNALGYGREPDLPLHLVYNPNGAFLPPDQARLEADYHREMQQHFGIRFNRLYTITNMPIARFASWLRHENRLDAYLQLLVDAFNPAAVEGLMCRDTISVDWLGRLYDCDFNQMLDLPLRASGASFLWELDPATLPGKPVATRDHCFGCTAGAGSSCGGSLA